jgi:glutamate dehydrogenase/leucine dehydrogenase
MASERRVVTGAINTHEDVQVAAAIDERIKECERLIAWLRSLGELARVGVEGTGNYGAGVTRHLVDTGVELVEVSGPNRQLRRRRGTSDTVNAQVVARAALN